MIFTDYLCSFCDCRFSAVGQKIVVCNAYGIERPGVPIHHFFSPVVDHRSRGEHPKAGEEGSFQVIPHPVFLVFFLCCICDACCIRVPGNGTSPGKNSHTCFPSDDAFLVFLCTAEYEAPEPEVQRSLASGAGVDLLYRLSALFHEEW